MLFKTKLNLNLKKKIPLVRKINTYRVIFFAVFFLISKNTQATQVPSFRLKTGVSSLTVKAGERVQGEPLKSTITLQPTIMWDLPTFRSRLGVHFLTDLQSEFGQMPISGIGVSGCFYIQQISSAYEYTDDGVLHQRSRAGFYVAGSVTPVNFNLNREAAKNQDNNDLSFATLVVDLMGGVGFDYPMGTNFILSSEASYRVGANRSTSSSTQNVSYSGVVFFISILTSYH